MAVQHRPKRMDRHAEHSRTGRRWRRAGGSRILRGQFPIRDRGAARGRDERLLVLRYCAQRLGHRSRDSAGSGCGGSRCVPSSIAAFRIHLRTARRWNFRFLAVEVRHLETTLGHTRSGKCGRRAIGINYGTQSHSAVLCAEGGSSRAVWKDDVASDTWTHLTSIPISRSRGSIR